MNDEVLLIVYNNHANPCPRVTNRDSGRNYYGYYENEFGEQWLFIYDFDKDQGFLRGGDVGWDAVYSLGEDCRIDLILSKEERAWLTACYHTATTFKSFRQEQKNST